MNAIPPIWLLAALPPLFWAGNFVLARALHADISPLALSFWRWAIALLVLLPFAYADLWRQRELLRRHWPVLTLFALLGITNYNTFAYLGLQSTTATNAVLLTSVTPVVILGLSVLFFRAPLQRAQILGILLSLAGVILVATEGRPLMLGEMELNRGDLWILAASLDWALYSVFLRWRPRELEPKPFLAAIIAIGLLPLLGLYAWDLVSGHRFEPNPTNLAAIGYVAVFPSVLAYVFWNRAVVEMGPNRTGQYMHLIPIFGAGLAVLLLGERLHVYHLFGALMIASGIALATGIRWRSP
ncbi:DMT family transporter [Thiocapsa roseopersicina]|uniref:Permease of the drug/metabolite transporter (DMT) superfamily n=1 Tax=Thiocapsa roseopersicina TaxID=1058 RepID=A0A1H2VIY4_THIRO|nr:DMT family transporter [Thiocapsa roseopersicina]SDW68326.1 Permease of the drug/metabolite transporter (DMT) superfamily [Thiocapsa roseopersicina]